METLVASVQYGDFVGEAKGDRTDHQADIDALLRERGVRGYPVAYSIYGGENYLAFTVYTTNVVGHDAVMAAAAANGGVLRVRANRLEGVSFEELLTLFKRFHVVLRESSLPPMEYET